MHALNKLMLAVACALPLVASAQSTSPTVTPAGQPRSDLEKQQTTQNGNAQKHGTEMDTGASTNASGDPAADAGEKGKTKRKMKSARSAPGATTTTAPSTDGTTTK